MIHLHHCDFFYIGDLAQRCFDLLRMDIFAAGNEHQVLAPSNMQISLLIQISQITGAEPAFGIERQPQGVAIYITREERVPSNQNLLTA